MQEQSKASKKSEINRQYKYLHNKHAGWKFNYQHIENKLKMGRPNKRVRRNFWEDLIIEQAYQKSY